MKIHGSVAVVTGGANGIGKAICQTLASKGAQVCLVDMNATDGKKVADELKQSYGASNILFVQADVASQEQLKNAFDKTQSTFGKIDIVVNNAGILGEKNWRTSVNTNLVGVIAGTNLAIEYMGKETGGSGGVIFNMSSCVAFTPEQFPYFPTYVATKAAILAHTLSWSANKRCKEEGIRFNVICPMVVDSPLTKYYSEENYVDFTKEEFEKIMSFEKIKPASVAEQVVQLVEDQTKTGAIIYLTSEKVEQVEYPSTVTTVNAACWSK